MANNNISEMTYEGIKSRGIANDLWAPFERAEAYPMDITSVFGSYETAASYAKNGATSYAGQTIAVAGAGVETKIYKITSDGTLVELVDAIALNLKQDKIEDLDDIRSGAALGVSASQDVSELKYKVTTLVGEDSGKTVRTIANEELVARLVTDGDSGLTDNIKSLKDIANWLEEHPENAAEMNTRLGQVEELLPIYSAAAVTSAVATATAYTDTEVGKVNTALSGYATTGALDAQKTRINNLSAGTIASLSGLSETVAELDSTVDDHENRLDAIENDCLVLTESKSLKLLTNETFNLGAMSCYNNFAVPIYLAKKSDGTYLTPLDSASTIASTETYSYTFGSSMGAGMYCNGITVRPYEIKTVRLSGRIEYKYLMVKVENAFCTLPSNTNSNGVNKDFGILLSNIDVDGSSTAIRRYCYAIYPGETLAIPLSSANLIPDNFILNNNINDVWSSGTFSPSSIIYNPTLNINQVTMSHVKDAPTIEYHQQIVGTISDTNLPNNKNIIIDNIQSAHDLRLPSSPRIGKKYEIIHTHKSATLKSGNVNIIRDEGYTNAQSLSASTVSSVIYNGVSWYFYTNLLSNIY